MLNFQEFMNELLLEKLMIFGKRAYPKFGHVVILAGGAGSGKGYQRENLLGIEGKVFDVDELKKMVIKSTKLAQQIKDETGQDIKSINLRIPANVSRMHEIIGDMYNIPNKHQQAMYTSIIASEPDKKPNLIFDVTLKDLKKLESISRNVQDLGYEKKNIHIVWVVNDITVAIKQNNERSRVVPEEILMVTHEGAALTMKKILDMGDKIRKYMDGAIYLSFNQEKVDTSAAKNENPRDAVALPKRGGEGTYITDANYIKVKEQGKAQTPSNKLGDSIYNKIKSYVPNIDTW